MFARFLRTLAIGFATTIFVLGASTGAWAALNNIVNQDVPEISGVHVRIATTNNCQGDLMAFMAFPAGAFDEQHPQAITRATSWAVHEGLAICPQATRMRVMADAGGKMKETASFDGFALASDNWQPNGRFSTPYHYGAVVPQTVPASPDAATFGVPGQFQVPFSQAAFGAPFSQSRENQAFLSAVVYAIVKSCNDELHKMNPNAQIHVPDEAGQYALSGMVASTQISESSPIQQLFGPFSTLYPFAQQGTSVGQRMGCSAKGRGFLNTMNTSVIASMHDAQGGPSQFMRTCPSKLGSDADCLCFARMARALEPDIFQERFSMYDYNKMVKAIQLVPAIQLMSCRLHGQ
ncbi:hypothetical protein [Paraburkholderia tuberum]|uniref:Uncharacterized protein n=1 Tax=Paraburkholderia tuberum TaxID=157910 RepID=A0A1H1KI85_9BURK|nr:hypothetical protein [Paraburkholderia tuberum]SDR61700.1 hypothetical protein SAMN05445850_7909 [Paraburkholderia tuberum]